MVAWILLAFVATQPVPFPQPVTVGTIEATPVAAIVSQVPLNDFSGPGLSKEECFLFGVRLFNSSSTKRVDFDGWPRPHSVLKANCSMTDEHGNKYKTVTFGISNKIGDDSGSTIEPGGKRAAIVVFEKPIPLAMKLTIDLDGEAVGQAGSRLVWTIRREDWERKTQQTQDEPQAAEQPESRTWTSADGVFTVEARFSGMVGNNVRLHRTADGKELSVPLNKLSDDDQRWIRAKRINQPQRQPPKP